MKWELRIEGLKERCSSIQCYLLSCYVLFRTRLVEKSKRRWADNINLEYDPSKSSFSFLSCRFWTTMTEKLGLSRFLWYYLSFYFSPTNNFDKTYLWLFQWSAMVAEHVIILPKSRITLQNTKKSTRKFYIPGSAVSF